MNRLRHSSTDCLASGSCPGPGFIVPAKSSTSVLSARTKSSPVKASNGIMSAVPVGCQAAATGLLGGSFAVNRLADCVAAHRRHDRWIELELDYEGQEADSPQETPSIHWRSFANMSSNARS
jgi:hypothetical protein